MRKYYVYILTNKTNNVLYIGVTNGLNYRIWEHRLKFSENSFAARYNLYKLVYFEVFTNIKKAIKREKQLKNWRRAWKIDLINEMNPKWIDYFAEINISVRL